MVLLLESGVLIWINASCVGSIFGLLLNYMVLVFAYFITSTWSVATYPICLYSYLSNLPTPTDPNNIYMYLVLFFKYIKSLFCGLCFKYACLQ